MAENLLQLQGGEKAYGSRRLFEQATFSINSDEHVGVIGPNGAGKTTLFKILLGQESLDSGQLVKSKKLNLGYLSQHDHWETGETGNTYLERISRMPLWQLKTWAKDLQLQEALFEKPVLSLSGGYRMRLKLLSLIGQEPNLMLLDEPTNYLDLETTLVLERFLQNYQGAFLLISHDREFLRLTTDHILEIEQGEVTKYNGNITDYFEQKELLRTQLQARAANQAEKRKQILDFVARFRASATKARQAQSRLKTLRKMETIEIKALPLRSHIRIPEPVRTGKLTLTLSGADFGYGDKKILHDVHFQIQRGDHVAVVGLNGAGKSTLLKGISGILPPLSGTREIGYGVEMAIFAQHVVEALDPDHTVYGALEAVSDSHTTRQEILDLAGSLLFSGDDVKKKVSVLSGGEKSRVALGRVLLQRASCLILDEPTNHLDFDTVEALTSALKDYPGSVVVVSHDRGFIKRVGTKILEVSSGKVRLYPGSYDEYVWSVQKEVLRDSQEDQPSSKKSSEMAVYSKKENVSASGESQESSRTQDGGVGSSQKENFNYKEEKKRLDRNLRHLEKLLKDIESELEKLQAECVKLSEEIQVQASQETLLTLAKKGQRIDILEEEWVKLSEEKENALKDLNRLMAGQN